MGTSIHADAYSVGLLAELLDGPQIGGQVGVGLAQSIEASHRCKHSYPSEDCRDKIALITGVRELG